MFNNVVLLMCKAKIMPLLICLMSLIPSETSGWILSRYLELSSTWVRVIVRGLGSRALILPMYVYLSLIVS